MGVSQFSCHIFFWFLSARALRGHKTTSSAGLPHLQFCLSISVVPNSWAMVHYWAVACSEPGHVSSWPVHKHRHTVWFVWAAGRFLFPHPTGPPSPKGWEPLIYLIRSRLAYLRYGLNSNIFWIPWSKNLASPRSIQLQFCSLLKDLEHLAASLLTGTVNLNHCHECLCILHLFCRVLNYYHLF